MQSRKAFAQQLCPVPGVMLFGLILVGGMGCENSFDPKGAYTEQLAVYSILSSRSDTQYVRVYRTYNPFGFNPLENTSDTPVQNAQVTLTEGSNEYQLKDTTIQRVDKSRYTDDLHAYVGYPFALQRGRVYTLTVRSDRGNVNASVSVPGPGRIDANNAFVMAEPERFRDDISLTIRISPVTRGYLVRIYLDFEYLDRGNWVLRRAEVPFSVSAGSDGAPILVYPRLTQRRMDLIVSAEPVDFSLAAYQALLTQLEQQYGQQGFRPVSATFILTQVENNLYKYYNIVNGFQDEYSIRTDLPDFSNIRGGVGLFGAMTDDSTVVDLR